MQEKENTFYEILELAGMVPLHRNVLSTLQDFICTWVEYSKFHFNLGKEIEQKELKYLEKAVFCFIYTQKQA